MTTTQLPDTASPSPLEVDLAALPKVSLHDHLDGGLRVGTVLDLAREAGVEVPADTVEGLAEWIAEHANGESLEKYLQVFALTTAVMQTREQLRRVAREFVEDLVADGVVYGEIRWAPEQHLAGGLSLDEAVEAADAAGHVIRVGQLVTAMRHADRAQEIAELAVRHREAGVVGFDIAGAEAGFPPSRFADTFTWLAAHHLPVTVHAGEGDGLDSVRSALVDGRAESGAESRTRWALRTLGLRMPTPQVEIFDDAGEFVARVDFLYEDMKLVIEVDGRKKYEKAQDLWDEKMREDRLRALGYVVVRLTWADLDDLTVVRAKIQRGLALAA